MSFEMRIRIKMRMRKRIAKCVKNPDPQLNFFWDPCSLVFFLLFCKFCVVEVLVILVLWVLCCPPETVLDEPV